MGILGQHFGTPPQLLEHHPIEPWGFWDNFLEHHPNFWNTTPSSRGDSGTTFWSTTSTFGTPPHRAVGILGQLCGPAARWGAVQKIATEPPPWPVGVFVVAPMGWCWGGVPQSCPRIPTARWGGVPKSLKSPQEIIMSGPLFDESRPGRGKK